MSEISSGAMSAWTWLAITGFGLFAIGMLNPIASRATFFHKEGPLKPILGNTLLGMGAILIVLGLVMRAR